MSIKRGVAAIGGGFAGSLLRIGIQLGATLVLARLLGPSVYGVYAIAASVIGFAGFFADFGVSYSLIQKPTVGRDDERVCFTWTMVLGLTTALIVATLAPRLAELFRTPQAEGAIAWLSLALVAQAASSLPANLLRRDLRNTTLQGRQALAYFVGYVLVGIPAALADAGIWALIAAWVTQAWLSAALLYSARPVSPWPLLRGEGAGRLLRSGGLVFVTNLVNWVLVNTDRVTVGYMFPNHATGVYANAMNLSWQGTAAAHVNLQSVFYALLRQAQGEHAKVWRAAKGLLRVELLLLAPAFAALSACSITLVNTLFGQAWLESAPVFALLMVAMPAYLSLAIATPVIWAVGRPRSEVLVQLPLLPLWAAAVVWAAGQSLNAVAITIVALYFLRAVILIGAMAQACRAALRELAPSVALGAALSALVWILVHVFDRWVAARIDLPLLALGADLGFIALVLLVLARQARMLFDDEAWHIIKAATDALPAPLRLLLGGNRNRDAR